MSHSSKSTTAPKNNTLAENMGQAGRKGGLLPPSRHHLDRRASMLAELGDGAPDDLLSSAAVAEWLGVSIHFLQLGRHRGYGPKFVRVAPERIRYRRENVLAWLEERTFASTAEYMD
jgi:hypothetical protein